MSQLTINKQFILENDKVENRPYQLYIEPVPGTYVRVIQENGTNPKIQKISPYKQSQFIGITEKLPEYSVRIVKNPNLENVIRSNRFYYLSFDGGIAVKCFAFDIQESKQPGLYWELILVKGSETINLATVPITMQSMISVIDFIIGIGAYGTSESGITSNVTVIDLVNIQSQFTVDLTAQSMISIIKLESLPSTFISNVTMQSNISVIDLVTVAAYPVSSYESNVSIIDLVSNDSVLLTDENLLLYMFFFSGIKI